MECPNCHRQNAEENRFCIHCGTPLIGAGAESQQPGDPIAVRLDALQMQLRNVTTRLAALERLQGAAPPARAAVQPAAEAVPTPALESFGADTGGALAAQPPLEEDAIDQMWKKLRQWDWEQVIGGNWLARIGVLALIVGLAFFLKLAFDNEWIGPTGRVVLGIVGGLAMLGAGEYWHKRYLSYAQALSGGGIALLYLATFAAYAIYSLIDLYPAVAFLLLLGVASAALALRYESMALAIIGIAGAFSAPFLLGGFDPDARAAGGDDANYQLVGYVLLVDVGVLVLSTFRNWWSFRLIALGASLAAYGLWYADSSDEAGALGAELAITAVFLIFAGVTTVFHLIWRRSPRASDQVLMVMNAAAYFGISFGVLYQDYRPWMGGFSLAIAAFYVAVAYLALRRSTENAQLSFFALAVAMVFLAIAVPVQLGDKAWTTIAWAAQGTILVWLSFALRMRPVRVYGYAVFLLMAIRLLAFDTPVELRTFEPLLNERVLAFAVGIGALYFSAYLVARNRGQLWEWEQDAWSIYPFFLVAANFFTVWVLTAEVLNYFDHRLAALDFRERFGPVGQGLENARNLSLTALWAVYASALLVVGIVIKSRPWRVAGLALLVVPIAKVFVYDVFLLEQVYRIVAFVGLGVLLLIGGYLYQRFSQVIRGFIVEK